MSDILSQAVSILEQRFLKNAFLPVLVFFPSIFLPTLLPGGRLAGFIGRWDSQSETLKIVEIAGYLAVVWFMAAIVASQWRNIVRLYEGYPFARWPLVYRLGTEWHRRQLAEIRQADDASGSRFFNYWAYPESADVLPTRLGNVLRAAEMYSQYRYSAEQILLWPRIYHILPRELLRDVDDARATLEFLLVVSLWFVGFAIGNPLVAFFANGSLGVAAGMFVGGLLFGYLAYVSAIPAAVEYGAYIRTAFELYRFDLLARLRLPTPVDLTDERRQWTALCEFILNGINPAWRYEKAESRPLVRSSDIQSSRGADGT